MTKLSRELKKLQAEVGDLLEESAGRASPSDLARWADDPVGWDLQADRDPVDYQRDVMRSVVEHRFTAWRGCHSAGKEFVAGSLAVWGAYARGMLVLVVSATEKQVIGQTMREVRRAWRAARAAHGIGGQVFQGSVRIGGEDRIIALTGSANVDALTGWHDPKSGVLVIISEGQGEALESVAYDAALSNANTGRGRILAMGNPVRPVGRFFEIHQRATWQRFRTSAFETPNVNAGEVVRPGFPGPRWPTEVAQEHGKDSSFYISRVLAEFPDQAEDALIGREDVDAAFGRFRSQELEEGSWWKPCVLGVDPSGLGSDASAVTVWQGDIARRYERWGGRMESTDLADRVEALIRPLVEEGGRVETVYVDSIGIGHGLVSILDERLAEWDADLQGRRPKVTGVNVSERAADRDRFVRKRDELLWHLRNRLVEGTVALAPSEELAEELLAVRMRQTPDGRIETESKRRMRSHLGRSPDTLDSLMVGTAGSVRSNKKRFAVR